MPFLRPLPQKKEKGKGVWIENSKLQILKCFRFDKVERAKGQIYPIWLPVFFLFSNEQELDEGIDPDMALTPFISYILDETRFEPTTLIKIGSLVR